MSLLFGGLFKPFIAQRLVCVMARCVLENFLNPRRIDALFERTAQVQYTRELVFSSVVDLLSQVVLGLQPSIHFRQHGQLKGELLGQPQPRGKTKSGKVSEQALRVTDVQGHSRILRRITVALKKPTRDGDWSLHLLTNLPARAAAAAKVAELYARRWTIETMFQELTCTLTCEIKTPGYPKAALFGFCLALLAYHAVSVIKAALRSVHGAPTVERTLSGYYLSLELAQTYPGMMIAIPPAHWQIFRKVRPAKMAALLQTLAAHVVLRRYQKHPRGLKRPPPTMDRYKHGRHVATAKLIARRVS
jgi:hypothetical protein